MSGILTPQKTGQGWVVELPTEMVKEMGISEGSIAVLHTKEGSFDIEILLPPNAELEKSVQRIYEKYKDAFSEMKSLLP